VMLVVQGGGGDGGAAMAETNQSVRLCQRRAAAVELQQRTASSARCFGQAERAGEGESE